MTQYLLLLYKLYTKVIFNCVINYLFVTCVTKVLGYTKWVLLINGP